MNGMTMTGDEVLAKDKDHLSQILDEGFEDGKEALVFSVNRRYKLDRSVTEIDGIASVRTMTGRGAWVQKLAEGDSVDTTPAVAALAPPVPQPSSPQPAFQQPPFPQPTNAAPFAGPPPTPLAPPQHAQPGAPYNARPYAQQPGMQGPPAASPYPPQYAQAPYPPPYGPPPGYPPPYGPPQGMPMPMPPGMGPGYAQPGYPYPMPPPVPPPQQAPAPMPQKQPPPVEDFRLELSPTMIFNTPNDAWLALTTEGKQLVSMAMGLGAALPDGDMLKQHAIVTLGTLVRAHMDPAFKATLVAQLSQAHDALNAQRAGQQR